MFRFQSLKPILIVLVVTACGDPIEESTPDSGGDAAISTAAADESQRPILDCETQGFPCTWAEVPAEIDSLSRAVAAEAVTRIASRDDWVVVAQDLATRDDVVEVMIGDEALRFRVEGGRPEWIFTSANARTMSGAPPMMLPALPRAPSTATAVLDPVGQAAPQTTPTKKALILSPFAWQWAIAGASDGVKKIWGHMEFTRDYEGRVDILSNDLVGSGSTASISYGVSFNDFTTWNQYQAIHVSTHGGSVCRMVLTTALNGPGASPTSAGNLVDIPCQTTLSTGDLWEGVEPAGAQGLQFMNAIGVVRQWVPVRYGDLAPSLVALGLPPQNPSNLAQQFSLGPFVGVATDFFRGHYGSGLSESMVFLNACSSGKNSDLVGHLSGSNSTVVGWKTDMTVDVAAQAAECVWFGFLGGVTNNSICQAVVQKTMQNDVPGDWAGGVSAQDVKDIIRETFGAMSVAANTTVSGTPVVGQSGNIMSSGDLGSAAGGGLAGFAAGQVDPQGDLRNRAIEIIRMMEPGTQLEFQDGGFISLTGTAGDGVPDTLMAELEIFGIGPTDDPAGMTLHVDVAGNTQSKSLTLLPQPLTADTRRTLPVIPLDMDLPPGGTLDLDVWIDYADGTSRWRYEDLDYDCSIPSLGTFQATITGGVGRTVRRGELSQAGLRPWPLGGWVLNLRNRFDSDFELGVVFGGAPIAGQSYEVHDASMQPPISFSGGIDFDTPDKASWFLGDATVRFDKVTPDGACGTLTADLIGLQAGQMAPRQLPVTITGRFWAESRP